MTNLQALRKRYVQLCDAEEYEVASGMKEAIDLVEGHLHGPRLTYKVTQEPDGSELIEYPWDTHKEDDPAQER